MDLTTWLVAFGTVALVVVSGVLFLRDWRREDEQTEPERDWRWPRRQQ